MTICWMTPRNVSWNKFNWRIGGPKEQALALTPVIFHPKESKKLSCNLKISQIDELGDDETLNCASVPCFRKANFVEVNEFWNPVFNIPKWDKKPLAAHQLYWLDWPFHKSIILEMNNKETKGHLQFFHYKLPTRISCCDTFCTGVQRTCRIWPCYGQVFVWWRLDSGSLLGWLEESVWGHWFGANLANLHQYRHRR